MSALDRGQATATNAPPYSKFKEVGDAVDLGSYPWLQFAGVLSILHEVEQLVLDALTCPKLDCALCMNLTEIRDLALRRYLSFASSGISPPKRGCPEKGIERLHSLLARPFARFPVCHMGIIEIQTR